MARAEARVKAKSTADREKATIQASRLDQRTNESARLEELQYSRERMASMLIPLVAVLCIAVVGVLSFTNVRDRQSEIGIFRAMGVTAGRILQVFLARAFLSGFLGSILGLGLLYFLGDTYKETHLFGYALEQLVDSQLLLQSLIFVPVLACLAAWLPSLQAARRDPAEILRYE